MIRWFSALAFCLWTAPKVQACSPSANARIPTLQENMRAADRVVLGTIAKIDQETDGTNLYHLTVNVEKVWKGSKIKTVVAHTRASTCNPFGQMVVVGTSCVLFLNGTGQVMAGVSSGEASFCPQGNADAQKTQIVEFSKKLASILK